MYRRFPRWELWRHLRIHTYTHNDCIWFYLIHRGIWFDQTYLSFCPRYVLTTGFKYSFSPLSCLSSLFIDKWSFWPKEIWGRRGICFKIINLRPQGPVFYLYITEILTFQRNKDFKERKPNPLILFSHLATCVVVCKHATNGRLL